MPNTQSAKKRLRQNVAHRDRNRSIKSAVRSCMKRVLTAANEGDIAQADAAYKEAAVRLDRAGSRGIIHPNATARYKSRLQRAIKRAKQAQ